MPQARTGFTAGLSPLAASIVHPIILVAAMLAAGPAADDDYRHSVPAGPWSSMFEHPLREALAGPIQERAPKLLELSAEETAELASILQQYQTQMNGVFEEGRRVMAEWDARFKATEFPSASEEHRKLDADRETALAPFADRQAATERELIDRLRQRFSPGREQAWQRLEYEMERSRMPSPGGHLPTGSVDPVAIAMAIRAEFPGAVADPAQLDATLATFCEHMCRSMGQLRDCYLRSERTVSRRMWLQARPEADPNFNFRDTPLFRASDEARPRLRRTALEIAALVLATREQVELLLEGPAKAEFSKRFWLSLAEQHQFVFWPASLEKFRDQALALANEEERQVMVALLDQAYRAAVARLISDEKWIRMQLDATYDGGRGNGEKLHLGHRARQEDGCKILNALCKALADSLEESKRAQLKVPNFHLAPLPVDAGS